VGGGGGGGVKRLEKRIDWRASRQGAMQTPVKILVGGCQSESSGAPKNGLWGKRSGGGQQPGRILSVNGVVTSSYNVHGVKRPGEGGGLPRVKHQAARGGSAEKIRVIAGQPKSNKKEKVRYTEGRQAAKKESKTGTLSERKKLARSLHEGIVDTQRGVLTPAGLSKEWGSKKE